MTTSFEKLKPRDLKQLKRIARAAGYESGAELFEEMLEVILGGEAVGWQEIAEMLGYVHADTARKLADADPSLAAIIQRSGKGKPVSANKRRLRIWTEAMSGD